MNKYLHPMYAIIGEAKKGQSHVLVAHCLVISLALLCSASRSQADPNDHDQEIINQYYPPPKYQNQPTDKEYEEYGKKLTAKKTFIKNHMSRLEVRAEEQKNELK